MHARKFARIVGVGVLLWAAVAIAGERGFFGYALAVKGGGFFLNPTISAISIRSGPISSKTLAKTCLKRSSSTTNRALSSNTTRSSLLLPPRRSRT